MANMSVDFIPEFTSLTNSPTCLGLTTRHAYSLLNLHGVEHVRLVQLRNPWAKDTWTGPYNNKCTNWTKELRAELMVCTTYVITWCVMVVSNFEVWFFRFYFPNISQNFFKIGVLELHSYHPS